MSERAATVQQAKSAAPTKRGAVLQRACACGKHTTDQNGECTECRKKRLGLQRRAIGRGPDVAPPIVHDVLRSPGRPLDDETRGFMESRFGHDFSGVRVHTDGRAAQSAQAVNALAYTVGNHVAFDAGQYAPGTPAGRDLLAHELAHVVQQSTVLQRLTTTVPIEAPVNPLENQAAVAATAVMGDRPVRITPAVSPSLARQRAPGAQRRSDTIVAADGRPITRTIVPGVCRRRPTSRRTQTSDIGQQEAFFEVDACRGTTGETLRGSLDYSDVIERFGNLITGLQSQRDPQQALRNFESTLRQATPRAQIRYTLQFSGFRLQTTAAGGGNLGGGSNFQVNGLLRYTNGQFNLHLEGGHRIDFAGDERQGSNTTLTLNSDVGPVQIRLNGALTSVAGAGGDTETLSGTTTVTFPVGGGLGIGLQGTGERTATPGGESTQSGTIQIFFGTTPTLERERGRDCFVCSCENPTIKYVCEQPRGDTPPGPTPPPRITRYFTLFYEYSQANPRRDWQQQYNATLQEVLTWLEQGYTIRHIEGRTSPEGPLQPRRAGGFEGNIRLAESRAERAHRDLRAVLSDRTGGALVMPRDPLTPGQRNLLDARDRAIPLFGRAPDSGPEGAELFGSVGGREVTEAQMFQHLSRVLQPPAAGQPDLLAQEHILGEGLTAEAVGEATVAIGAFQAGQAGRRRQLIEQVFRVLRRALIVLNPPAIPREDLFLSGERARESIDRIEAKTLCSLRQQDLINNQVPMQSGWLFDVQCEEQQ